MRAHTITTKARAGRRGRTKRAIVPCGVLALSLAVVLMAATASTAGAERTLSTWYCPALTPAPTNVLQIPGGCLGGVFGGSSFDFGDRQVGTASPVQLFALGVYCLPRSSCLETLNPSIDVSGDYAQTNDCPATLSASAPGQLQGCLIEVTFTPTGTGPDVGALSTGPGGPTVRLTGNGVTHATPPAFPLLFDVGVYPGYGIAVLEKRLMLYASTNYDSTVVARGGVKRTVAQLAGAGPRNWKGIAFQAKLKHLRRLKESTEPNVRIKFTATDEFGQRATEELKVKLCEKVRYGRHEVAHCVR